jgi:hypothetical protein
MADRQTRQVSENLKVGAIPLPRRMIEAPRKYNAAKILSAARNQQITGQCYFENSEAIHSSLHDEKNFNQFCF